jgi:hypothetical protein
MPAHHRADEEPEYTEHDYIPWLDDTTDHPLTVDGQHHNDLDDLLDQHLGTDTRGGWRQWYYVTGVPTHTWEAGE